MRKKGLERGVGGAAVPGLCGSKGRGRSRISVAQTVRHVTDGIAERRSIYLFMAHLTSLGVPSPLTIHTSHGLPTYTEVHM